MATSDAARHVLSRRDLNEFHYQFPAEGEEANFDAEHRHSKAWRDSTAWTHCICFGAAARAVEPLLAAMEEARDILRQSDPEDRCVERDEALAVLDAALSPSDSAP